jgi:hypothetical protein
MNLSEVLSKATSGTLSRPERLAVGKRFRQSRIDSEERYELLLILGRAAATEYESDVAAYLTDNSDPMLTRLAVQVLCNYWGLADKYIGVVAQFCKGSDWDSDEDVRLVAISATGEYLRGKQDPAYLSLLLDTYDSDADDICRNAAYSAIARAMGREWSEIPSPRQLLAAPTPNDPVIESARQLVRHLGPTAS